MRPSSMLALLGPGLLVAATGVGAGDLITASLAGERLGLAIVWAPLAGALLKWSLTEGLARWQLATGTTLLQGWSAHLGRVFRWAFGGYLVLWSFVVGGALASACGVAGAALLPFGDGDTARIAWGVAHSLGGLALVRRGGFRRFEAAMSAFVALMFVGVLATAALLVIDGPPGHAAALASALASPAVPDAAEARTWVLGVLGGVGGTVTLLSYGYWIAEHGRRGAGGLAACRVDLAVSYGLTGLFGAAMIVVGSRLTLGESGDRVALEIARTLGERFGAGGRAVFLLGFWGAVFSSLLGVWQGVPYLFADFLGGGGGVDSGAPAYRRFQVALATVPLLWLGGTVAGVQLAATVLGALFMPLLAATLLLLGNRRRLVGADLANGPVANLLLAATLAVFVVIGWRELREALG